MNRRSFLNLLSSLGVAALPASLQAASFSPEVRKPKTSFSFAVIADPHASEGPRDGLEQYGDGKTKFFHCIERIKNLPEDEKPDFILILGDLHFFAIADEVTGIDIPIHPIAGNHESVAHKKQLREMFPNDFQINGVESDYYSFEHKGVTFIGLCNAINPDHIGHLCSDQIIPRGQCEWLERELAKNDLPKIIFSHIPLEPNGQDKTPYLTRNDSRYLIDVIGKYKPNAIFFGHHHLETRQFKIDDCVITILRACSWNFRKAPIGFGIVKVSPEGFSLKEIITGHYRT